MKVLYFANHSEITGANLSLIALITHIRNHGVEVRVIIPTHGPIEKKLQEATIPYDIIPAFQRVYPIEDAKNPVKMAKNMLKALITRINENKAYDLITQYQPDLIHINTVSAKLGFRSARKLNIPVVWHVREMVHEDHGYQFLLEKYAYRELEKATRIIAISDSVYKKFHSLIPKANMVRIYNGVDTDVYYDESHRPFENDTVNLTIAGRIKASKGFEDALGAMRILCEQKHRGLVLQIAGDCYDAQYFNSLKQYVSDHNMEQQVHFIGFQPNMADVWRKTDIALVCSKAEAFGRVTVEAMLCGALVIGADTMGTKELVHDGENGFLYSQGSEVSLAAVCEKALDNKEACIQIVNNAIRQAKEEFTAQRNAEQIEKLYREILN